MRWLAMVGLCGGLVNLHPRAGCAQGAPQEFREVHLGMEMRLVVVLDDAERAALIARRAFAVVEGHEAALSDWRPQSEVRRLEGATPGEWTPISEPLRDVLALALRVARATDGAFDPTVGPLTELWREVRRTGRPVNDTARAAALARVGFRHVDLDSAGSRLRFAVARVRLDLGGIAKGWILDRALESILTEGASAALVEAGGDLVVHGTPPGQEGWRVRVPRHDGDTVLVLTTGAVSSSGPEAQYLAGPDGGRQSHVLDPRTGEGAGNQRALTVVGPSGAVSDAMATALSLLPVARREGLAAEFGVRLIASSF